MRKMTEAQIWFTSSNCPVKPPCGKSCTERNQTCHFSGHCEKWDEYQKKLEEYRRQRQRRIELEEYIQNNRAKTIAESKAKKNRRTKFNDY